MKRLFALLLCCCLCMTGAAASGLDSAVSPFLDVDGDVRYAMSAQIDSLVPYGEGTIAMLNGVLKHLSVDAVIAPGQTSMEICVSGDPVMDFVQREDENGSSLTTSLLPNRTLTSSASAMDVLAGTAQQPAFDLFACIAQLEECYRPLTDAIIPFAEEKTANYKIESVGRSKWSRIARLTEEQSAQLSPLIAAVLGCGMDEAYRAQLQGITCSKGFIVGLYQTEEGGSDMALYMKGIVTLADGKPRKLAFQWAFTTQDGVRVDTLKYEMVKSKTAIDFSREVHASYKRRADSQLMLDGECEVIVRQGSLTTTTTLRHDLNGQSSGGVRTLEGTLSQAVRTKQGDASAQTLTTTFTPKLRLTTAEGSGVLSGAIGVEQKDGKTVVTSLNLLFDEEAALLFEQAAVSGDLFIVTEEISMPQSSLSQNIPPVEDDDPEDFLVGAPPIGLQSYSAPKTMTAIDLDAAAQEQIDALMGEAAQNLAGRLLVMIAKLPPEDQALILDNLTEEDAAAFRALIDAL